MKRILSWILLLALLLPMIPAVPAQAAEMDNSMRPEVRSAVSKVITDYAKSIYRDTAAVDAIMELGLHAIFRNGAFLNMNERDPVIASLFSANLFQVATIDALTDSILTMQKIRQPELYVYGGPHWHHYNDSFTYSACLGTEKDYSKRIGSISTCKAVYGSSTFSGSMNRNDYAMQLLIGGLSTRMIIRQGEARNGKVVYNIRMIIRDDFDFDSDYSGSDGKGYDTTLDQTLVRIGRLLERFAIDVFEWEFVKDFQIEVPFPCDHQMGAYSWELDPETMTMHSVTDGFLVNSAKTYSTLNETTGKYRYYYRLEKPVQLNHDKPWVVEYEANKLSTLALTPTTGTSCLPFLRQYSRYYTWAQEYEYKPLLIQNNSIKEYTYTHYYWAAKMQDQYKYYSKHTYTYRIENVPAANGTNMIYFSVYDNDLGQEVLPPTPMNDYMTQSKGEKSRTLVSEEHSGIVGKDFVINYIGNKSYYLSTGSLKLSIWENGEGVTSCDNVTTVYKAPTCTEDGGLFHTCRECGYGYVTNVEKALGHSYGSYTSDSNAGCEKDGTKTATCGVCGYKDTVTDAGTATGHNIIHQEAVEVTCDTPGLTAGSYCDRCYTVYEEQVTIPAPGHDWQEATCETPKTCNTCGAVEGEPTAHQEVTVPGYAATCLEDGLTDGIVCGDCGLVILTQEVIPASEECHGWQDATCEAPKTCTICGITEGEALGHTESTVSGIAATCTESGMTDGTICGVCSKVLTEQELIPALGHSWQDATCEAPQTCSTCGATEGEAHAHTERPVAAIPATCTESGLTEGIICDVCETVIQPQLAVSALGHSWQDATCAAPKTCATCFATEGEALAHTEVPVSGYAATCTKDGLTDGVQCSVCSAAITPQEVIPAPGHTWQEATCTEPEICTVCSATQGEAGNHNAVTDKGKAPTCTASGLTEGSHCADCGQVLTSQTKIDPLGHDWQDATCTNPDTCSRCSATTGAALGHDPVEEAGKDATCTEDGLTKGSYCATCDQVLVAQKKVEATGHRWKDATCTEPKICRKCNTTQGAALGHDPVKKEGKDPTCTRTGTSESSYCSDCRAVIKEATTIPATGHTDKNSDYICDVCNGKIRKIHGEDSNSTPNATGSATEAATEALPEVDTQPVTEQESEILLTAPQAPAPETDTEAETQPETGVDTEPQQESTSANGVVIFGIIALLCLIAAIVLWLLGQKKHKG